MTRKLQDDGNLPLRRLVRKSVNINPHGLSDSTRDAATPSTHQRSSRSNWRTIWELGANNKEFLQQSLMYHAVVLLELGCGGEGQPASQRGAAALSHASKAGMESHY